MLAMNKSLMKHFLKLEAFACFALICFMWLSWQRNGGFVLVVFFKILLIVQILVSIGLWLSWLTLRSQSTEATEISEIPKLESKYSGPVEACLITIFIIGLLGVTLVLFRYVIHLDFMYAVVGDSLLARKSFVALVFVWFVVFFYRPFIKVVLYHQQK